MRVFYFCWSVLLQIQLASQEEGLGTIGLKYQSAQKSRVRRTQRFLTLVSAKVQSYA